MKRNLLSAYAALLICFGTVMARDALSPADAAAPPAESAAPEYVIPLISEARDKAPRSIRVIAGGEISEVSLQDYLVGVVAAEMPALFEREALKAQTVAARSYALYCAKSGKHGDADVCTEFSCCQAWKSLDDMKRDWGDGFEESFRRIAEAVASTEGEYLCYDDEPVFAAFHSSSAGFTEECGAIWGDIPYLQSVSSPESAETVPNYISSVTLRPLDFRDTLLSECPEADFSDPEECWIGELTRDESGRVASVCIGGVEYSGVRLRSLFNLRSTAFTLSYDNSLFVFTVTGFGHGVGMSQYGANVLASEGADYTAILAHYYPGTVLVS